MILADRDQLQNRFPNQRGTKQGRPIVKSGKKGVFLCVIQMHSGPWATNGTVLRATFQFGMARPVLKSWLYSQSLFCRVCWYPLCPPSTFIIFPLSSTHSVLIFLSQDCISPLVAYSGCPDSYSSFTQIAIFLILTPVSPYPVLLFPRWNSHLWNALPGVVPGSCWANGMI